MENTLLYYLRLEFMAFRFLLMHKFFEFLFAIYCALYGFKLNAKRGIYFCQTNKYFHLMMALPLFSVLLSGFIHEDKSHHLARIKSLSEKLYPLVQEASSISKIPSSGYIQLDNEIGNFFNQYDGFTHLNNNAAEKYDEVAQLAMVPAENINHNSKKQSYVNISNIASNKSTNYDVKIIYDAEALDKIGFNKRKKLYSKHINKYSRKYGLNNKMVLSIVYAESLFFPHLISKKNAHGLMQIVPTSAGREVFQFLKKQGQPSESDLMHPETNIYYGTAYLYLLQRYHLAGIEDASIKNLLTIASYNAGSSAVLRHFDLNKELAIEKINSMNYNEVLSSLMLKFKFAETKRYVQKVLTYMST